MFTGVSQHFVTASSRRDFLARVRGLLRAEGLSRWALLSGVAALAATTGDALLQQRKYSLFTGGFLSREYLTSSGQTLAFLATSWLIDLAVLGLVIALVLRVTATLRRRARTFLALAFALGPYALANAASYELHAFLGDAFDLALMFDLAGRNPGEILAVSSAHLMVPVAVVTAGVGLVIGAGWLLHRTSGGTDVPATVRRRGHRWYAVPVLVCALVAIATTVVRTNDGVLDAGIRRKPAGQALTLIVNGVTDVDRDGFALLSRPNDPSPYDATISPFAVEIPGNGVDEDGLAGDLPADVPAYVEGSSRTGAWQYTPDVVLFALESFRADAVGAVLNGKPVTPVLDALAARGVQADRAYSHNGYTAQSRFHLFSGSIAGLRENTTLIDDFRANGYEIAYFSAQDESFGGPALSVGFDRADVAYDARSERDKRYTTFTTAGSLAIPLHVLQERIQAYLDARKSSRPLFLYVNFHDTHFPYTHRRIEPLLTRDVLAQGDIRPANASRLRDTYLNTAANVDRAIGQVLDRARARLGKDPATIVIGDHGESLFDGGYLGHGYALNEVQTRIPLIVANLALDIRQPFGQADLRDAVRAALERPFDGRSSPRVENVAGRSVFQYLGRLPRPRQIAAVSLQGRTVYDFHAGRVSQDPGDSREPTELTAAGASGFRDLVWTWERMKIAAETTGKGRP